MSESVGFDQLTARLDKLLAATDEAGRVRFAHRLGRELRKSQARRIRDQRDPDGAPFVPRKARQPLRAKAGRIKRRASGRMFRTLGGEGALRWDAVADGVSVGFAGAVFQRIARVHQWGLRDRVSRQADAPEAQYPARTLLGLTEVERARILELAVELLA